MSRKRTRVFVRQGEMVKLGDFMNHQPFNSNIFQFATEKNEIMFWEAPISQSRVLAVTINFSIPHRISYKESHIDSEGRAWVTDVRFLKG